MPTLVSDHATRDFIQSLLSADSGNEIVSLINGAGSGLPGTGTVTSVSVVSANGVSGVVANPTTTPAITLSLGDITPTSVAAAGTVTGSNLSGSISGTNTGDQTITLSGDVTGTGTGPITTTIQSSLNLPGAPTTTTALGGDNSTKVATTAFVTSAISPLATDSLVVHLSGTETITGLKTFNQGPAAPTASPGTNTTQLATTAFVLANVGTGGDKNFVFNQLTPASTWSITHNLGKYPSVNVYDSANNMIVGDVVFNSLNALTLTFSGAFSGQAILN